MSLAPQDSAGETDIYAPFDEVVKRVKDAGVEAMLSLPAWLPPLSPSSLLSSSTSPPAGSPLSLFVRCVSRQARLTRVRWCRCGFVAAGSRETRPGCDRGAVTGGMWSPVLQAQGGRRRGHTGPRPCNGKPKHRRRNQGCQEVAWGRRRRRCCANRPFGEPHPSPSPSPPSFLLHILPGRLQTSFASLRAACSSSSFPPSSRSS